MIGLGSDKNDEDDDDAKHNKECLHTISLSLHQSLEGSGDHADLGSKEQVLKTQLLIFRVSHVDDQTVIVVLKMKVKVVTYFRSNLR